MRNPQSFLKLEDRYRSHLKYRKYSTKYRQQKVCDTYSYLRFIYTQGYPLTETLTEYLNEFSEITYKEYTREYAMTRIRHVKDFIEWYIQYIELLFYHKEFIGDSI